MLIALLVVALIAGVATWAFGLGRTLSEQKLADEDVAPVQQVVPAVEPVPLEAAPVPEPGGPESQVTMLRSAQEQLMAQVKALESENTRLKEDLALFERFLPSKDAPQGIAVQGFTAETVEPNQIRYRLLVMRNGQSNKDFDGNLEIAVNLLQSGKTVTMSFPEKGAGESEKFDLSFRYYQRVEGILTLPENATIKSVQARVLEKGKLRAQQSVDL